MCTSRNPNSCFSKIEYRNIFCLMLCFSILCQHFWRLHVSSIHFYGHWQTTSDGFKSQNIILGLEALYPGQLAMVSLISSPGLWLVRGQPMRGSHRVTWPRAPPLSPPLCSELIQFAHISVRVLIKYSDVISKVAWIRTNSHLNTLHTIYNNLSYLNSIFL